MSSIKTILFLYTLLPYLSSGLQKDEIIIVANGVQEVRVPIEKMPLIADESDTVFASGLFVSITAIGGTAIYGIFTYPFPFNDRDCGAKYRQLIFNQSKETSIPCDLKKTDWINCIESLIEKYCDAERAEYDRQLSDKKIAAWTPLMVAAVASVGFNSGWLLGKWIGRAVRSKKSFGPAASTAIEVEEV